MRKNRKQKSRWKEFLIDIGDTIGGIFVGLSFDADSRYLLIFGVILIMTSIYLEYFEKGKEDGEQTS
jgi:uncharacterized membrane protein HdeD (DUF308 family)